MKSLYLLLTLVLLGAAPTASACPGMDAKTAKTASAAMPVSTVATATTGKSACCATGMRTAQTNAAGAACATKAQNVRLTSNAATVKGQACAANGNCATMSAGIAFAIAFGLMGGLVYGIQRRQK